MKKYLGIFTIITILLLNSCASNNKFVYGRTITTNELETIEIIGSVETFFETTIPWNKNKALLDRSYYELLKAAKANYTEEIDVKNIIIERQFANKNYLLLIPISFGYSYYYGFTNIHAKGEVIRLNNKSTMP